MRSAPSVTYPVGRSPFLALLLSTLWLMGALGAWGVGAVGWDHSLLSWRPTLMAGALGLAGVMAWRLWRALPTWALCWNGQDWKVRNHDASANNDPPIDDPQGENLTWQLSVALDLQRHLLLRLEAQAAGVAPFWVWAHSGAQPSLWHPLRCAVYSRAPSAPDGGSFPP